MFFQTNVQCPYCTYNNKVDVHVGETKQIKLIFECGTCQRDFALYSTLNITSYVKEIAADISEEVKES